MDETIKSIPITELQEAPKDALSDVIKKLGISIEISTEIQGLEAEDKELCQKKLEKILKEVEEQKLGPTDRDKKIKNTLEGEYGIAYPQSQEVLESKMNLESKENLENLGDKFEKLQKNLESVKKIDPTIVGEELANAKASNPLPNEVKVTIAKSSNSTPEQVDEAIKSGNNPQINNLIDTYYLTNPNVQTAIEKRLPETKLGDANIAFQELRASARDFPGLQSPFTPKDLPSRISDKSDATQGKVIETVNSLTKGAPDTVITRDGDRLSWEDKKGSKYEIDMAVRPPKLTKSLGSLYLSRTEHEENPEVKILQQDIESNKKDLNKSKAEIGKNLDNSGVYGFNPDNYSPDELRQLFSGVDISSFEQKLNDAKTTEQQTTLKEELKNNREGSGGKLNKVALQYMEYILDERIQIGNSGIEGASSDTVSSKDWMEKLTSLKELKSSKKIEEYATEKEELQKKEKKLGEIKSPSVEEFDEGSDTVLKKLNSLGLDKIGQKNLDALIQGLAARDNGVGIWKSGGIDMDDTVVRENQIKDLEQVASQLQTERRNNSKTKDDNSLGNVFGDISNMIKGNDSFRNLWNSPVGLSLWLKRQGTQDASPKTETPKNNPV